MSQVRIHDDAEADKLAKSVNAVAFTTGQDIFFQTGKYDPNSQTGLELLAHEVTHTVQQSKGQVAKGIDPDAGLELEAQSMGKQLASQPIQEEPTTTIQLKGRTPQKESEAVQRKILAEKQPHAVMSPQKEVTVQETINALLQIRSGIRNKHGIQSMTTIKKVAVQQNKNAAFWDEVRQGIKKKAGDHAISGALKALPSSIRSKLSVALLGGAKEITYLAFMNQLAMMSYSNDEDLSDVKNMEGDISQGGSTANSAQKILRSAGYKAMPTVHGLWGFQMRVFKPDPKVKKPISKKVVVAFRGTEGLIFGGPINVGGFVKKMERVNLSKESQAENESFLDTATDLIPYPTGYSQYEANEKLVINRQLKMLPNNMIAVGHSLGSALVQITVAKNPNKFSEIYTFQGAKIQKSDVEKLMKKKQVKARHFAVRGDVVPLAGQESIPGQFNRFSRSAKSFWSMNFTDGHNTPIMIEMLRKYNKEGLLNSKCGVSRNLIQYGSEDSALKKLNLSGHTAKRNWNQERTKQLVVGREVQANTFIKVYENNVIYNIYVERVMERIKAVKGDNPNIIVERLSELHKRVTSQVPKHTANSLHQLNAFTEYKSKLKDKPAHENTEDENLMKIYDLKELKGIDSRIIDENKDRLLRNMPDL